MWIDFWVFLFEDEAQIIKPKHVMTTRIKSILSKVGKSIKDLALNNVLSPNFLSPRRHLKKYVYFNDWLGGSKWLNPPQISSHQAFSRIFFKTISAYSQNFRFRSLRAIHTQNLSIFFMIEQFLDFLKFTFRWVFAIWPNCEKFLRNWSTPSRWKWNAGIL